MFNRHRHSRNSHLQHLTLMPTKLVRVLHPGQHLHRFRLHQLKKEESFKIMRFNQDFLIEYNLTFMNDNSPFSSSVMSCFFTV